MIENFSYITEDGIILVLKLGAQVDKFEGIEETKMQSFFKGQGKGITWNFGNNLVQILEVGKKIEGFPTPDLKQVIVIYPFDHPVYPAPLNAVIYNANGEKTMQLKVPKLISPIANERKSRMKNHSISNDASFRGVYWDKDDQGKISTVVTIDFDWEWWESRILNPETGEFGECLSSGRR
jgi:hypothetical protein